MTLNVKSIKEFWDNQAEKAKYLSLESVANLEENTFLIKEKISTEKEKILPLIALASAARVLDIGGGTGQWSFRFSHLAKEVFLVEYSQAMIDLAILEGRRLGIDNITYICSSAEKYDTDKKFDLIFISGLLIYLNDTECQTVVKNCFKFAKPNAQIILRDGTGVNGRFEIKEQFSSELNSYYSATYRTAEQYIDIFQKAGFSLIEHSDMFFNESPLNKRLETRLRLYQFNKP